MNENQKENKETRPARRAVAISRPLATLLALGVVGIVISLGEGLADYLQADPVRWSRVVMRSLSIAVWLFALFVLLKSIKNDRKR